MRQLLKITLTTALALIFTAGMAFGQESDVRQETDNNTATVNQNGPTKATVVQKGNSQNSATLDQFGDVTSTIKQVGFNNRADADVSRKENNKSSTTRQVQRGNNNIAFMNKDAGVGSSRNRGTDLSQVQVGNRNVARMRGNDEYAAKQVQRGSDNFSQATGLTSDSDILQKQVQGNNNSAVLGGNIGSGVEADQVQVGSQNTAKFTGADVASFVTIEQRQEGFSNRSLISGVNDRRDARPTFSTRQNGNNNLVTLQANDNAGALDVDQLDNQNTARVTWNTTAQTTIYQGGFSNTAIVNSGSFSSQ